LDFNFTISNTKISFGTFYLVFLDPQAESLKYTFGFAEKLKITHVHFKKQFPIYNPGAKFCHMILKIIPKSFDWSNIICCVNQFAPISNTFLPAVSAPWHHD